jgi:hypothetical protein
MEEAGVNGRTSVPREEASRDLRLLLLGRKIAWIALSRGWTITSGINGGTAEHGVSGKISVLRAAA